MVSHNKIAIAGLAFLALIVALSQVNGQPLSQGAGAPLQFRVDNWQIEQGLPVNSIISIAQTRDGWLYFGTEEGVARFDGNSFLLMNKINTPALGVNFATVVLAGRDTSLWIGTEGDGVIKYRRNTYTKLPIRDQQSPYQAAPYFFRNRRSHGITQ